MRFLRNFLRVLVIVIALTAIGIYFYLQHIKPSYKGEFALQGLEQPVEVWFDDFGVPHIYASSKKDLYTSLGYLHAQERLWQMELVRRIAPGRLSEILGKDLTSTDKFFRTLGIHHASVKAANLLRAEANSSVLAEAEAYLAGVNQYVENGPTPMEYTLLGIEKTSFTLEDIYNAVGYMSFSFAAAHKTDPLVSLINAQWGPAYLADLGLKADSAKEMIPSYFSDSAVSASTVSVGLIKILEGLPVSPFIGSNSWVLGPAKTKSGKVLFANDPHIGFSQPSVWYEAYLNAPGFELYGYHLAGYPFAILGHNRDMALGLTMLENDDVDFFRETTDAADTNKYQYKGEWLSFESRTEQITIKGEEPVTITVRSSVHGPEINDVLGEIVGEAPVTMWWVFNQLPNRLLQATHQLNNAKSMQEAAVAASMIHAPGLNVMYGDSKGNVAWWATARLVKRPAHVNSFTILNGATGEDDPLGFFPFEENPHSVNPPAGYVYSANNQPDRVNGYYHPGYYLPEDRAKRIRQLIDAKDDWDRESVKRMLLDEMSLVAAQNTSVLLTVLQGAFLPETAAKSLKVMEGWDGTFSGGSAAPIIYTRWLYYTLEAAIKDEIGQENFELFMSTDLRKRTFATLLANDSSVWWDDQSTEQTVEERADILNRSFVNAVEALQKDLGNNPENWQWSDVHTLTHNHALGVVPMLGKILNVGPFKVSSGEEIINNLGYPITPQTHYSVSFGPSTRRVIDFAEVEQSESILPTGQSGVVSSRHYDDQAAMFVNGEFRKMVINKKELTENGRLLILNPQAQ